jgi:hypothetical protein
MARATGDAKLRAACDAFLARNPDAKALRDVLTHFDAYEAGTGKLQSKKGFGDLAIFFERGESTLALRINDMRIALNQALSEADALLYASIDAQVRLRERLRKARQGKT